MSEIKCPVCQKVLNEVEIENNLCCDCGCFFVISNKEKGKIKRYSSIIKDTRKMKYLSQIRLLILLLLIWSTITCIGIAVTITKWNILRETAILLIALEVALYIFVFGLLQFFINLIRDVYLIRIKLKDTDNKKL